MKSSLRILALSLLVAERTLASDCKPSAVCTDIITDGGFDLDFDGWAISTTGSGSTSATSCATIDSGYCPVLSIGDGDSSVTLTRSVTLISGVSYELSLDYNISPSAASFGCTVEAAPSYEKRGGDQPVKRIAGGSSRTTNYGMIFQAPADTCTVTCTLTATTSAQVQVNYLNIVCP
ncbi:hypothetical protein SEUCBS139899_010196 [Sporothrix eucalyptigena]|uniref:Uncharacterized protein n=1 Tax=Sporothrix eucalyptigena TaxID=1812306 RepID=A0ABP0AZV4_9PEZI